MLVGAVMILGAWQVRTRPRKTAIAILTVWLVSQVLLLIVFPLTFVFGLLGRLLITGGLVRCVVAAGAAEALRRDLVAASIETGRLARMGVTVDDA